MTPAEIILKIDDLMIHVEMYSEKMDQLMMNFVFRKEMDHLMNEHACTCTCSAVF